MKMWPLIYSTVFICAVFIIEAASGQTVDKIGVIGGTVSFGPASLTPPVSSITWKHSSGVIVKAIEWDGDEPDVTKKISVPNPRFKGITTLDEKTGNITIANLNANHAGTYILEINSKEQGQKFKLEVLPPVPKPKITIERIKGVSDIVYLECRYNETITWKNSAGETLEVSKIQSKGESITVRDTGKPENSYTCTLKNTVSESTSDPVYKSDLFKPSSGSNAGQTAGIVILFILLLLLLLLIAFIIYQRNQSFRGRVNKSCPCIGSALNSVTCFKKQDPKSPGENQGSETTKEPDHVNKPLLKNDHDKVAEVQKSAEGNPDSNTTEINEYVNMDEVNPAGPDQNNAGGNQGAETTESEAVYVLEKNGANPEYDYDKVSFVKRDEQLKGE